ncbi:hypothetical protein A3842_05640 [Paenibacillus sp. P3E]|nr:hypothetical protein A3842_05640 [Paenibacillus sp. P3E]
MSLLLYLFLWVYDSYNKTSFDYGEKAVFVFGVFIAYTFIRVIAEFISFNGRTNMSDVYSINEHVNNKIKNSIKKFVIHEDGIYEKKWKLQDNGMFEQEEEPLINPLELYYSLLTYMSILKAIGSYSSTELHAELELLLESVEKSLSGYELNNQLYVLKD